MGRIISCLPSHSFTISSFFKFFFCIILMMAEKERRKDNKAISKNCAHFGSFTMHPEDSFWIIIKRKKEEENLLKLRSLSSQLNLNYGCLFRFWLTCTRSSEAWTLNISFELSSDTPDKLVFMEFAFSFSSVRAAKLEVIWWFVISTLLDYWWDIESKFHSPHCDVINNRFELLPPLECKQACFFSFDSSHSLWTFLTFLGLCFMAWHTEFYDSNF